MRKDRHAAAVAPSALRGIAGDAKRATLHLTLPLAGTPLQVRVAFLWQPSIASASALQNKFAPVALRGAYSLVKKATRSAALHASAGSLHGAADAALMCGQQAQDVSTRVVAHVSRSRPFAG